MSFRRYEAYKDSGVDWIGVVPDHWTTVRLNYRYEVQLGRMLNEERSIGEDLRPYLRVAGVQWNFINTKDLPMMDFPPEARTRYRLMPGDLLVNEGGSYVGRSAVWRGEIEECYYQKALHRLRPRVPSRDLAAFFLYVMETATQRGVFIAEGNQTTIDHLTAEQLRAHRFSFPPRHEQPAIVAVLDRETAKIDALVEEQQRLIALLKEKRQAVICQAVTKGLDPDAPMKDSGVEWLGEVPAHWDVVPLMHLTQPGRPIMYGIVLPGPDVPDGIPIVKGGDVKSHRLRLELLNRTTPEIEAPYARARLKPGDIVYSIRGTIGDAELVPDELLDANITQDAARIAPLSTVNNRWLLYAVKSKPVFVQLEQRSLGAAVRGINIFELKRARLPVPPPQEQLSIATHLDDEARAIDRLCDEAESAIALLQERRSALISAAVTGKIDVRDLAPATAEAA